MGRASMPSYNRVLNVEDYPDGMTRRKQWEIARALETLITLKAATPRKTVVGIGAGHERTLYELTNHTNVIATDRYGNAGEWRHLAPPKMLLEPEAYAPEGLKWKPERLTVLDADVLQLPFDTGTLDGLFCTSSIEHVGNDEAIARAASEMGRILKPGGVASISTEWRLWGGVWGFDNVRLFNEERLQEYLIGPSGLELVDEFWPHVSEATLKGQVVLEDLVHGRIPDFETCVRSRSHEVLFTSVHLALRKPK